MNAKEIKAQIFATMREFGFKTAKLAVELDGKLFYLTEPEVRALQIMVKRNPKLRESIKVYNGRTKRKNHVVEICENGYFDEPMNEFFAINTRLAHELMYESPKYI